MLLMNSQVLLSILFPVLIGAVGPAETATVPQAAEAPELKLDVTFDRTGLLTSDTVFGEIWIENPSESLVDRLYLHLSAPGFLRVGRPGTDRCVVASDSLSLEGIGSREFVRRPICLVTAGEIVPGEHSTSLYLTYRWRSPKNASVGGGYARLPLELRIGVLGPEGIPGVPLQFAAFIIPGLLIFILLRWLGASPDRFLKGTEIVTAGVLLSMGLIWATGALFPPQYESGMSLRRFGGLCVTAALLAGILAASAAAVRWYLHRHTIWSSDSDLEKLCRLLRATRGRDRFLRRLFGVKGKVFGTPVAVHTFDDRVLFGTVAEEKVPGEVRLLGWLEIGPVKGAETKKRLTSLVNKRKWSKVSRIVKKQGLGTDIRSAVHEKKPGGFATDLGGRFEVLLSEVRSVCEGPHQDGLPEAIAKQEAVSVRA